MDWRHFLRYLGRPANHGSAGHPRDPSPSAATQKSPRDTPMLIMHAIHFLNRPPVPSLSPFDLDYALDRG